MLYGSWGLLQLIKNQGKDIPTFNTHTSSLLKTQKRRPFATGSLPTPFASFSQNGASVNMQNKWKNMSSAQRTNARKKYKDTDGDRVPDKFDCQPRNPFRQDWDMYQAQKEVQHIEWMPPLEFLRRTRTDPTRPGNQAMLSTYYDKDTEKSEPIQKLASHINNPDKLVDIPFLEPDGDHEGRHRAWAAHLAGERLIPVATTPPESWRTQDIVDETMEKRFPKNNYGDDTRKKYGNRIKTDTFPTQTFDLQTRRNYREVLESRDLAGIPDRPFKSLPSSKAEEILLSRFSCFKICAFFCLINPINSFWNLSKSLTSISSVNPLTPAKIIKTCSS